MIKNDKGEIAVVLFNDMMYGDLPLNIRTNSELVKRVEAIDWQNVGVSEELESFINELFQKEGFDSEYYGAPVKVEYVKPNSNFIITLYDYMGDFHEIIEYETPLKWNIFEE